MAERNRGHANTNNSEISVEERIASIIQIMETLDYPELLRLRNLIDEEYNQKAEAARVRVIAESKEKLEQLGSTFEDVVAMQSKRKRVTRTPAKPKYMSPEGIPWTGRGQPPRFIREHEEAGGSSDDFLIK